MLTQKASSKFYFIHFLSCFTNRSTIMEKQSSQHETLSSAERSLYLFFSKYFQSKHYCPFLKIHKNGITNTYLKISARCHCFMLNDFHNRKLHWRILGRSSFLGHSNWQNAASRSFTFCRCLSEICLLYSDVLHVIGMDMS